MQRDSPKFASFALRRPVIASVSPEITSSYKSFPVRANPQLDRLYPIIKDGQRQFRCAACLFLLMFGCFANKTGRFEGLGTGVGGIPTFSKVPDEGMNQNCDSSDEFDAFSKTQCRAPFYFLFAFPFAFV